MTFSSSSPITSGSVHGGYPSSSGSFVSTAGSNGTSFIFQASKPVQHQDFQAYTLPSRIDTDILPSITLKGNDVSGVEVTMTLTPEQNIGPYEALKLAMLMTAYSQAPHSFNPLAYVRSNNLERHFKYT